MRDDIRTSQHMPRHLSSVALALLVGTLAACDDGDSQSAAVPDQVKTFTLQDATIEQIQEAMDAGALTSVELVSMYLNRIAIYDHSGIKINSIVAINPSALADAEEADRLRAAGTVLSPIHGTVTAPKMNHAVQGLTANNDHATTSAISIPLKDAIYTKDSVSIDLIKKAGGIVLGLANEDYWSGDGPGESFFGAVLSPFNGTDMNYGSSSSGPTAAVAANFVTFSFGGDHGGSNRGGTVFGVESVRTTASMLSSRGIAPIETPRDQPTPMARTVRDVAIALDIVAKDDANDPAKVFRFPDHRYPATFTSKLNAATLAGTSFGYIDGLQGNSPEEIELFNGVKETLEALGAEVKAVPAFIPWDDFLPTFNDTSLVPTFTESNMTLSGFSWAAGEFFRNYTSLPAAGLEEIWGVYYSGEEHAIVDEWMARTNENFVLDPATPLLTSARQAFRDKFEQWLASNSIDALIAPTYASIQFDSSGAETYPYQQRLLSPLAGLPASIVSVGATGSRTTSTTVEFVGPAFSEENLLSYADAYERATSYAKPLLLTPPLPGETIEYTVAAASAKKLETTAPTLLIGGSAKMSDDQSQVVIDGTAIDASGLGSIKVYVNGRQIPALADRNWKAVVGAADLRKMLSGRARSAEVMVVAKDVYGNASATTKSIRLPSGI